MITTTTESLSSKPDRRRRENRPQPLTALQTLRDEMLLQVGSKKLHERSQLASIPEDEFDRLLSNRGGRCSTAALYNLYKRNVVMENFIEHLRIAQENGCLEDVLEEVFA